MSNYNTKQRDEILNCLKENGDRHLTANDIYTLLKSSGKSVGRTTVYRYLDSLVQNGSLIKYDVSGGENCYQSADKNCPRHYHMVCDKCGRLIHISCSEIDEFVRHFKEHHGFTVDMTKTAFHGICRECGTKDKGANKND